jgi:hypothetical protein
MWLPDDAKYTAVVTDQCELFFLQLWHNMVHRSATDSFRMRCMNSLNILEELRDGQDLLDSIETVLSGSPLRFILHPSPSAV